MLTDIASRIPARRRRPAAPGALRGELAIAGRRLALPAVLLAAVMISLGRLVSHVLTHSWVGADDSWVDRQLAGDRTPIGNAVTAVLSVSASTLVIGGLTAVAAVVCRLAFRRWRESLFVVASVAGETGIFCVTTLAVDRKRPLVPHLDVAPPTSSFPSGHSAAAVCFYGALAAIVLWRFHQQLLRAVVVVVAVLLPLLVAVSRLYRGMHFPTDVLGGLLLGTCWLTVTTRRFLHDPEQPRR